MGEDFSLHFRLNCIQLYLMIPESARENFKKLSDGDYAIGVSGQSDSTALLRLFLELCPDAPRPVVVHLDHQLRGEDSSADAEFVRSLCQRFNLPFVLGTREEMESLDIAHLPNPSARWRYYRHFLFKKTVKENNLRGVLLAHHADDQAETILQRLLRQSTVMGLGGMDFVACVEDLTLYRPLLTTTKHQLREYLRSIDQPWREDASNTSEKYQRNRVRQFLAENPDWVGDLIEMGDACRELAKAVRKKSPDLTSEFAIEQLADLPELLARESARKWLSSKGAPAVELVPDVLDRLIEMAKDASSSPKRDFPGKISVRRKKGKIL